MRQGSLKNNQTTNKKYHCWERKNLFDSITKNVYTLLNNQYDTLNWDYSNENLFVMINHFLHDSNSLFFKLEFLSGKSSLLG